MKRLHLKDWTRTWARCALVLLFLPHQPSTRRKMQCRRSEGVVGAVVEAEERMEKASKEVHKVPLLLSVLLLPNHLSPPVSPRLASSPPHRSPPAFYFLSFSHVTAHIPGDARGCPLWYFQQLRAYLPPRRDQRRSIHELYVLLFLSLLHLHSTCHQCPTWCSSRTIIRGEFPRAKFMYPCMYRTDSVV